jgi:hypothetical protein
MAAPAGGTHAVAASITSLMSHESRCRRRILRLDGGEVEEVAHHAPEPGRLGRDPVQEPLLESRSQVTSGCIRLDA